MKKIAVLALLAAAATATSAHAAWTLGQWNYNPDNGHYYSVQAITGGTTGWLIARGQAQALTSPNGTPVDLVTLTSAAEDRFVFDGIDSSAFWTVDSAGNDEGPNIGLYQTDKLAEPAGHWAWVTGEAFVYTQWNPSEPSNQNNTEDYGTFFATGSGRSGNWNDIGSDTGTVGAPGNISFYVAETTAVPEPASLALVALAAPALLARRRR